MTLGDPHSGACTAEVSEVTAARVKTCCNTGYARGVCPSFPPGEAPDAVRFGIVSREAGAFRIRYVRERDHHPYDDGVLQIPEAAAQGELPSTLERQARAFLESYLRRSL